ncbi:MAG: hypothetical protein HYS76_00020 [Candidatus Wildermuthbacteria bacterium]|nr:hypothetical protein [Candidatus Wildermuthbacteria bacterium]
MSDSQHLDETDISFVEYVAIFARHKWFVFVIIASAALGSVAWSVRQPLFYTTSTSLSIGRIDGRLAESYTRIKGKLQGDVYGTIIRSDLGIDETRFPQIKSEGPENTNLLLLSVKSITPEEGVMILRRMNEIILADHEGFIKNEKEMIEQNIQRIYAKIGILEQEKKNISGKIQLLQDTAPSQQNLEGQLVLFDIRGELEAKKREINELYGSIDGMRRTLRDIEPTRILKEPMVSEYVIRPNLLFNATAGGLGGAIFAIVFVFMREWWQRSMRAAGSRERS